MDNVGDERRRERVSGSSLGPQSNWDRRLFLLLLAFNEDEQVSEEGAIVFGSNGDDVWAAFKYVDSKEPLRVEGGRRSIVSSPDYKLQIKGHLNISLKKLDHSKTNLQTSYFDHFAMEKHETTTQHLSVARCKQIRKWNNKDVFDG